MITLLAVLVVVLPVVALTGYVFGTVRITGRAGDFPAIEDSRRA
jgi:hypothetical protein